MANASAKVDELNARLRYLIDIIVIALAFFGLDAAADALPLPDNFRIVIVVSTLAKCVCLVLVTTSRRAYKNFDIGMPRFFPRRAKFVRDMTFQKEEARVGAGAIDFRTLSSK